MTIAPIFITKTIAIYNHELTEKFIHSGGPGGQNVNKVATSVQLRFDLANSSLPQRVKDALKKIVGTRLNNDGSIIITASRYRTQERNREDARNRLSELVSEAAKPPPPKRRPTRPSLSARKKRMDSKTKRGSIKALRGRVNDE